MGERIWDLGRSPAQHTTLLVFGLLGILTGFLAASMFAAAPSVALALVANVLLSIGAFFLLLALFLGAYTSSGDSPTATAWRIAQIFAAVLVLWAVFGVL
jgi:hypothetical protein